MIAAILAGFSLCAIGIALMLTLPFVGEQYLQLRSGILSWFDHRQPSSVAILQGRQSFNLRNDMSEIEDSLGHGGGGLSFAKKSSSMITPDSCIQFETGSDISYGLPPKLLFVDQKCFQRKYGSSIRLDSLVPIMARTVGANEASYVRRIRDYSTGKLESDTAKRAKLISYFRPLGDHDLSVYLFKGTRCLGHIESISDSGRYGFTLHVMDFEHPSRKISRQEVLDSSLFELCRVWHNDEPKEGWSYFGVKFPDAPLINTQDIEYLKDKYHNMLQNKSFSWCDQYPIFRRGSRHGTHSSYPQLSGESWQQHSLHSSKVGSHRGVW